ncbi:MAG: hypothetical protein KJ658_08110 [Proteobacteria bacterium]|nr:hypothetical protein [Pseudomonadota bacterium]
MQWKFWEKNTIEKGVKLSKPEDLYSCVGKYLVVNLEYDPDWVWQLKSVAMKRENTKKVLDFRAFDPLSANLRGIQVLNYKSLDEHPELIYFDGWYNKETLKVEIKDHYKTMKKDQAA